MIHKKVFVVLAMSLVCLYSVFPINALSATVTNYTADWTSIDKHVAAPEWFKDAKLGVYFHWGVYSVPNHSTEWYGTYMYDNTNAVFNWHTSNFGDQSSTDSATAWGYDKFITGKNNKAGVFTQFCPKLKSAGGNFDPQEFADMLDSAGAWYAGPVAMHHDGFAMWDSKATEWCAGQKGPKLDLVKLLTDAFRAKNMKIVTSFHHAYRQGGFWSKVPPQTAPGLKMFYAQRGSTVESQWWYDVIKEVVDAYEPDMIWHDFGLRSVGNQGLNHLAYYYNQALKWKKDVVVACKNNDFHIQSQIVDYERNMPLDINTTYWQSDDGTSSSTWAYRDGMSFFAPEAVLHAFIDRVSKGGNLLLNFGPKPDGSIAPEIKNTMYCLGNFLKKCGEAIYCTRLWTVYGEGTKKYGTSSGFTNPSAGTGSDIRYTLSKDGKNLFAIFLGWPGSGTKTLTSVTTTRFPIGSGKVYLYGATPDAATSLTFSQSGSGLQVTFPATAPFTAKAYAIKISQTGEAPKAPPDKPWPNTNLTSVKPTMASVNQTSTVVPMARMFINGSAAHVPLAVPAHATSVDVYSLQGKKLFGHSISNNQRVYRLESSRLPAGSYYVKFAVK